MPNCVALKAIPVYSKEKPFILPVEAILAFQDTSASSSLLIKVKRSGVSAKLLSRITCNILLLQTSPVRFSYMVSFLEIFLAFVGITIFFSFPVFSGFSGTGPFVIVRSYLISSSWIIRPLLRLSCLPKLTLPNTESILLAMMCMCWPTLSSCNT